MAKLGQLGRTARRARTARTVGATSLLRLRWAVGVQAVVVLAVHVGIVGECGNSSRVWRGGVGGRCGEARTRAGCVRVCTRGRVLCGLQHVPKQPCGTASLSRCSTVSAVALHTRRVSMRRSHTGSAAAQQWGVCSSGPAEHCESQHGALGLGLLLLCFCVSCMIAGWLTSVGKPGADGKAGPAGKDGKDGKDGDALLLL